MIISKNGNRQPIFYLYGLDVNHEQTEYVIIALDGNTTVNKNFHISKNDLLGRSESHETKY